MRLAIWASGTPQHFLIHVHGAVKVIQQMGLDSKFNKATNIAKDAYSKAKRGHKKKEEEDPHPVVEAAKMTLDNAWKAWDDVEAKTDVVRDMSFSSMQNFFWKKLTSPGTIF